MNLKRGRNSNELLITHNKDSKVKKNKSIAHVKTERQVQQDWRARNEKAKAAAEEGANFLKETLTHLSAKVVRQEVTRRGTKKGPFARRERCCAFCPAGETSSPLRRPMSLSFVENAFISLSLFAVIYLRACSSTVPRFSFTFLSLSFLFLIFLLLFSFAWRG